MYQFGKFRFDPANHLLLSGDDPVPVTPKAFDILLVLVQNGRRLTTKEELMRKVWPDSFVEEANLTVNISSLRRLLGKTEQGQPYIETVPKKGYRFVAVVQEVAGHLGNGESSLDGLPAASAAPVAPASSPSARVESVVALPSKFRRRRIFIAAAILVGAVALSGYFAFQRRLLPAPVFHQPRRLAVLPFQNLRANAESDFLGFSLADAIITKLVYVRELSVRPSYAVQKYRGQVLDPRKIARELDVDTLLSGTFQREGDDLRVTCQLVEIDSQNILWKGAYDLKYDKILTLQDSVASQIINGLELSLSPLEAQQLRPASPVTPLAYEYYLRGIDLYSSSDYPMAIHMFQKSTDLAPDYALAWANLGRSLNANANFQLVGGDQYDRAQQAFQRALTLQPNQIDAQIYMANMFTDTGRVEQAVPLLRQALTTNPNHAEIHWELGYAYRFAGMLQQSVQESELARRLDPNVKLTSSALNAYLYLGQYDRFLRSLPDLDDSALIVFYRGFVAYHLKDWEAAARQFDRSFELDRSLLHAQVGKALSLAIHHRQSDGLAILRSAEAKITQRAVGDPEGCYKIAQAYAALGDKPAAFRVLQRSINNGFFSYSYFLVDPFLDPLRQDPQFQPLLASAKLRHDAFAKAFF